MEEDLKVVRELAEQTPWRKSIQEEQNRHLRQKDIWPSCKQEGDCMAREMYNTFAGNIEYSHSE